MLKLLRDHFAVGDYLDTKLWDLRDYNWAAVIEENAFTPGKTLRFMFLEIRRIIQYMPEGIPFEVRALLFM